MNYIYLGKIVNTHGIKGEIRIKSNFLKKNLVFKKGFNIYIGDNYQKEVINSYRVHKDYDMVTLVGIKNINNVSKYKGAKVYINKDDLKLNDKEYLIEDLVGMKVVAFNKCYGEVIDVVTNKAGILLVIKGDKKVYVPCISEFINKVHLNTKEIEITRIEEFL